MCIRDRSILYTLWLHPDFIQLDLKTASCDLQWNQKQIFDKPRCTLVSGSRLWLDLESWLTNAKHSRTRELYSCWCCCQRLVPSSHLWRHGRWSAIFDCIRDVTWPVPAVCMSLFRPNCLSDRWYFELQLSLNQGATACNKSKQRSLYGKPN